MARRPAVVVLDSLVPVVSVVSARARISRLEKQLSVRPDDYGLRWRAAQEYAQFGLTVPDRDTQKALWGLAHGHAAVATALNAEGLDGHYWLASSASLLADVSGGRTKVRLGDEAFHESTWVLERDSTHAGAHYLQGRIHASVMRMNSVMRFLAKQLVGGEALANASWENAEFHIRRAAELEPDLAMHHFELALVYEEMDMPEQMHRELLNAVAATRATPYQDEYKARAYRLLDAGR